MWWPELEKQIQSIPPATSKSKKPSRTQKDILEEILSILRSQQTPPTSWDTPYTFVSGEWQLENNDLTAGDLNRLQIAFTQGGMSKLNFEIKLHYSNRKEKLSELSYHLMKKFPVGHPTYDFISTLMGLTLPEIGNIYVEDK